MKICFLDSSPVPYTSNDLNSKDIRGAENAIIHLSSELSKLKINVDVFNNCAKDFILNGVKWSNMNKIDKEKKYDYAFTNNDIRLFDKITANKFAAFSHSIHRVRTHLTEELAKH